MRNLLKIELFRIRKSKAFIVVLIIAALTGLLNVGAMFIVKIMTEASEEASAEAAEMLGAFSYSGYDMFKTYLATISDILMYVAITASVMICGSFSAKTLQNQISSGYSRTKVMATRLISTEIIFIVYAIVYLSAITVLSTVLFGFGVEVDRGLVLSMIIRIIVYFIANMGNVALLFFIIFSVKSLGIALGITIPAVSLGTSLISILFTQIKELEFLQKWCPFGNITLLRQDLSPLSTFSMIFVGIVSIVMVIFIQSIMFRKANLK